jgi:hypothetical protein
MWLLVPKDDNNSGDEWLGTIQQNGEETPDWTINLVRQWKYGDPDDTAPFGKARSVRALLNLTDRCTLISPRVIDREISVGSPPDRWGCTSLVVKCDSLLRGIALDDFNQKIFTNVSFDSQCFDVWENGLRGPGPLASTAHDRLEDHGGELYEIFVPNVGSFKFTTVLSRHYRLPNYFNLVRSYNVNIDFLEELSIEDAVAISTSFDLLMGFLIGHRPKSPIYNVQTLDDRRGELEISYLEFTKNTLTNHFTATHLKGLGDASLENIMKAFYQRRDLYRKIIYCIDKVRFFSGYVIDNFRIVMPILESYLRELYRDREQHSFLEEKGAFLKLIDSSTDMIKELCKKHVTIKGSKALGLKNLLRIAIGELNNSGYEIDLSYADRITDRRGSLFHSDVEITRGELIDVYDETLAMAAMLMLLALRDLGLDIGVIAVRNNAFTDLRRICGPTVRGGRGFSCEVS